MNGFVLYGMLLGEPQEVHKHVDVFELVLIALSIPGCLHAIEDVLKESRRMAKGVDDESPVLLRQNLYNPRQKSDRSRTYDSSL